MQKYSGLPAGFLRVVLLVTSWLGVRCDSNPDTDFFLTVHSCYIVSPLRQFEALVNDTCAELDTLVEDKAYYIRGAYPTDPPLQKYKCSSQMISGFLPMVYLLNSSILVDILHRNDTANSCALVNFYVSWCPFSARLAPYYNSLPRSFPSLPIVAVDAYENSKLNTRFGILGTPTVLLFHNGKPVARFNSSEYSLNALKSFIQRHTDLVSAGNTTVEDEDLFGPLPTRPVKKTDYYLILSWVFIVVCAFYYTSKLSFIQKLWDTLRRNWREANEDNL